MLGGIILPVYYYTSKKGQSQSHGPLLSAHVLPGTSAQLYLMNDQIAGYYPPLPSTYSRHSS